MKGTLNIPDEALIALDFGDTSTMERSEHTARMIAQPVLIAELSALLDASIADEDATDVRVRLLARIEELGGERR